MRVQTTVQRILYPVYIHTRFLPSLFIVFLPSIIRVTRREYRQLIRMTIDTALPLATRTPATEACLVDENGDKEFGGKSHQHDEKDVNGQADLTNGPSHSVSQAASAVDSEKGSPGTDGLAGNTCPDENIVWWDGDDDPQNPFNWPTWRKLVNCILISALTFVTPLASCTLDPPILQSSTFLLYLHKLGTPTRTLISPRNSHVCARSAIFDGRVP